jgi:predicted Fe-Mo cluster-binding NifX family protein
MKALNDQKIDAIIVGGIGAGALTRLNQTGIICIVQRRQRYGKTW